MPSGTRGARCPRLRYRYRRRRLALVAGCVAFAALAALALVLMPPAPKAVPALGAVSDKLAVRPEYLFSLPASGTAPLDRPVSVTAGGGSVYVVDSASGVVRVFDERGEGRSVIGSGTLDVPVYVARDPERGILYVTDRKRAAVLKFDDADGSFVGTLSPTPAAEGTRSAEATAWAPLGIDVADDGMVWVTDILRRHRVLVLEPDGTIVREIGGAQAAREATGVAVVLDYPTGICVGAEEVWVSDSNNRRVVVFGRDGVFRRVLDVDALARGIDFVPATGTDKSVEATLVVVADALAGEIAVWDASGTVLGRFGGPGTGPGQLAYPNDVSTDSSGKLLYVADTGNKRVQVWEWVATRGTTGRAGGAGEVRDASGRAPYILGAAALLLASIGLLVVALAPLTFVVTADFVEALSSSGRLARLEGRGRRFVTTPSIADAVIMPTFVVTENPGVADGEGALRALVRRHRLLLAEDSELARDMRAGGADTFDALAFADEFLRRRS